jgi:N-acetyl sugar amidotransferase
VHMLSLDYTGRVLENPDQKSLLFTTFIMDASSAVEQKTAPQSTTRKKTTMEYCKRCLYPTNTRPTIIFDEQGVCSGCRVHESRPEIDWSEKQERLREILTEYAAKAKANGARYDCIIPVGGGKDSTYQVYYIKEVMGFNPLCVTYNHGFNTARGMRNLRNLVEQFDVDLLRFTTSPGTARRLTRYFIHKIGDVTWHYHAGIMTYPARAAVMTKIPLVIWGEHGYSDLMGMYGQEDMMEFSKKDRQEHSMRGFEPDDVLADPAALKEGITEADLAPFYYPNEEDIEALDVRGIYLANFFKWDAREQGRKVINDYNFETALRRERTHHLYEKLEDIHANGTHDYLKYLKFGYGCCTDQASCDIRHGRMTREEGIAAVMKHDPVRPSDLDLWLDFTGFTEKEFLDAIEPLRDPQIWAKDDDGTWYTMDNVGNHANDPGVDEVRVEQIDDREILQSDNQPDYVKEGKWPEDTEYIWL